MDVAAQMDVAAHLVVRWVSRKILGRSSKMAGFGGDGIFGGSGLEPQDRKKVARAHERVRNCRNDFQHKVSRQLADENQAVAAETLNVKGMMKNRRLSAAIADVGWNGLLTKVEYKLKRKGGRVAKIDRWFPSSKRCSCCGAINKERKRPIDDVLYGVT